MDVLQKSSLNGQKHAHDREGTRVRAVPGDQSIDFRAPDSQRGHGEPPQRGGRRDDPRCGRRHVPGAPCRGARAGEGPGEITTQTLDERLSKLRRLQILSSVGTGATAILSAIDLHDRAFTDPTRTEATLAVLLRMTCGSAT